MTDYRRYDLERSQQSIYYPIDFMARNDPVLRSHPDYFEQLYPRMLIEDIALGIMPIGRMAGKKPFRVVVSPLNPQAEGLITRALARNELTYRDDLSEVICDFFYDCAQIICSFGEAIYELVYLAHPESGAIVEFELQGVPPRTVKSYRSKMVQYVPLEVAQRQHVAQCVELSRERILTFSFPKSIRRSAFERMLESLAVLSTPLLPEFALQGENDTATRMPFDYKMFNRSQLLALTEAGKLIGWNARGRCSEETLEYYGHYRQLLFEKFKIELRTSILGTLNEGLDKAGQKLGFSVQLEIEGLPTLKDIEAAQAHLAAGDQLFREIIEPFLGF
jgi:hypothetical protein